MNAVAEAPTLPYIQKKVLSDGTSLMLARENKKNGGYSIVRILKNGHRQEVNHYTMRSAALKVFETMDENSMDWAGFPITASSSKAKKKIK